MVKQPSLFDLLCEAEPAITTQASQPKKSKAKKQPGVIEWSYSRRDLLERCPRHYYYNYYGGNKRTAPTEPQKTTLHFLKSLSNRYERTGHIAHLIIATYLRRLKEGDVWTLDRLLQWAESMYKKDLYYSRAYIPGTLETDTDPKAPVLLSEFYYRQPNAEALWQESFAQLRTGLRNFFTNPIFEQFRQGATEPRSIIEKRVVLKEPHFTMSGSLDLAYPQADRITIVDWKSGMANGSEDSLQLFSYALLARKEFACSLADIDLYRVHLADGVVSPFCVTERDALRIKARIIQDLEKMQVMERYGTAAVVTAFTPCGQPRMCASCPFQEVCPKE